MKYALRVLAGVVRDGIVPHKTVNVQKHYFLSGFEQI